MTVADILNACKNVRPETEVIITDRFSRTLYKRSYIGMVFSECKIMDEQVVLFECKHDNIEIVIEGR